MSQIITQFFKRSNKSDQINPSLPLIVTAVLAIAILILSFCLEVLIPTAGPGDSLGIPFPTWL